MDIKTAEHAMNGGSPVIYQGSEYLVRSIKLLPISEGKRRYSLELLDKSRNSILYADIERVNIA